MSFFNGDIKTDEFIIGAKTTTNAKIQMFDTNSTNTIIIQTPDDIIANYSITLPNTVGVLGDALVLENNTGSLIFSALPSASRVVFTVKNDTLTTIPSGTPVYITGITAGNSGKLTVDIADSSNSSKMPAAGIIEGDLIAGAQGYMVEQGEAFGIPTEGLYSTPIVNDTLFVAPGGGLTDIKPTYPNLIQNIGRMGRVHIDNGFLIVTGPSRTNDIPNLGASNIWIGKSGYNTQEASIGGDLSLVGLEAANEGIFTVNGISNTSTITSTANITMDSNKLLYFRDTTSNIYSDAISNLSLEASNINISGDVYLPIDNKMYFSTDSYIYKNAFGTLYIENSDYEFGRTRMLGRIISMSNNNNSSVAVGLTGISLYSLNDNISITAYSGNVDILGSNINITSDLLTIQSNITMDSNKLLYFRDTTSNIYSDAISNLSLEASNINITCDLLTIQSNIIVSDGTLTFASGETVITENTVIGAINFQAPAEASGDDARLICASIEAVADADFTDIDNSTKLIFKTAKSELAPERMKLENNGKLTITQTTISGSGIGPAGIKLAYTEDSNSWTIFRWGKELAFQYVTIVGFLDPSNAAGLIDFTGQHRSIVNTNIDNLSTGLILSSTGKYINLDNTLKANINESLPICEITNIENDKRVYGVLSDKEDTDSSRNYSSGVFVSVYQKYNKNEQRMYINSLGEGGIWVCNKAGSIESGDYITSSTIPGYGIKQSDNILYNYTVAKSTCDCTFSLIKVPKKKLKLNVSTDEDGNIINNIDYDAYGNVQYEDDLTETGNQQMEYPLDTRFLETDGTQITETEYTTKLNNGETVYVACFIGCTYHCG
jgi:hypothetical protein